MKKVQLENLRKKQKIGEKGENSRLLQLVSWGSLTFFKKLFFVLEVKIKLNMRN